MKEIKTASELYLKYIYIIENNCTQPLKTRPQPQLQPQPQRQPKPQLNLSLAQLQPQFVFTFCQTLKIGVDFTLTY